MTDHRRARFARIRQPRSELDASWSPTPPVGRQATALELAKDEVPWLLAEVEQLSKETASPSAQLDDCGEMLDTG
jgi:hypothetical protein